MTTTLFGQWCKAKADYSAETTREIRGGPPWSSGAEENAMKVLVEAWEKRRVGHVNDLVMMLFKAVGGHRNSLIGKHDVWLKIGKRARNDVLGLVYFESKVDPAAGLNCSLQKWKGTFEKGGRGSKSPPLLTQRAAGKILSWNLKWMSKLTKIGWGRKLKEPLICMLDKRFLQKIAKNKAKLATYIYYRNNSSKKLINNFWMKEISDSNPEFHCQHVENAA